MRAPTGLTEHNQGNSTPGTPDDRRLGVIFLVGLLSVALVSRVALLSSPYYADGPAFVEMLGRGLYFARNPPSYFLFLFSAQMLMKTGLSPTAAITALNCFFSVAGVFVFAKLCELIFPRFLGQLLSAGYAVMNVVWFAGLIHSAYAASSFLAPLLVYCLLRERKKWYLLGCVTWALCAGFRPSDGAFLFPLLILGSLHRSWSERVSGGAAAAAVVLAWWVPTAFYYHSVLGPLAKSLSVAGAVSTSVSPLRGGINPRTLANILRFVAAVVVSLNILIPHACLQLLRVRQDRLTLLAATWVLPGSLFLVLIYMSGAIYISFMAGGLLLLAGLYCRELRPRIASAWIVACVLISTVFMLAARPVSPDTFPRRVLDAYFLQYTGWSVRHHYGEDLSKMERNARSAVPAPH